jgi:hypothetical protein
MFIYGKEDFVILNQLFVLNSHWGRGNVESLMISFMIKESDYNAKTKQTISDFAKSFVEVMRKDKELYQGFYTKIKPVKKENIIINKEIVMEKEEKIRYLFNSMSKIFDKFSYAN